MNLSALRHPIESYKGWKASRADALRGEVRPVDGQGPFTSTFNNYIPHKVDPLFYEALREAIPIIDAGCWKLTDLDGHLIVEGDNDKLVDEIQDWMDNVPVCGLQSGLQAFHQNITNETFEQGFGIGEFLASKKRDDIAQLVVADSKSIRFKRDGKNGIIIQQKADIDMEYRDIKNPENIIYQSNRNENMNPYGTSTMRSMPFCGKVLATMNNSLLSTWERFGDPSYHISYKATKKGLGPDTLESRRTKLSTDFKTAIQNKSQGYSEDFVTAVDKDSDITVTVIGHDGQVLEIEAPARYIVEQVVAAFGLPSWMLGLHWSTTERLSDKEVTMLQEARATRHMAKLPIYTNLIKTLLLLRGRTWKKGDWQLKFAEINLYDEVKKAQARFLNSQADYYVVQNAAAMGTDVDPSQLSSSGKAYVVNDKRSALSGHPPLSPLGKGGGIGRCGCGKGHHSGCKEVSRPTPWPELDKLETEYQETLGYDWDEFRQKAFAILGLGTPDVNGQLAAKGPEDDIPFIFTTEQRAAIMAAFEGYIGDYMPSAPDSPVTWYYGQSYSLGTIQAAHMVGADQPVLNILKNTDIMNELYRNGFQLVKERATKRIIEKILPEIDGMVISGTNPVSVAARLKKLFGDANSDWERLARTELSIAAEEAKLDEWGERGINTENAPIPGKDTHPRCRCANTVEKVGDVWVVKFVPAPDACPLCKGAAIEGA